MQPGLEGVIVAETVLSHSDPERGGLWVRGRPIAELVEHEGYEGTVALLWEGFAGRNFTRAIVQQNFGAARQEAFAHVGEWLSVAKERPLDEAVRIGLALLPDRTDPAAIVATLAVFVAAAVRARAGKAPLCPDPNLPVAADVLRMLHDVPPSEPMAKALDTYLTVMAESGLGPIHPRQSRYGGARRLVFVHWAVARRRARPDARRARRRRSG
jgi:citrate synthase